jgi:hypothetical protein
VARWPLPCFHSYIFHNGTTITRNDWRALWGVYLIPRRLKFQTKTLLISFASYLFVGFYGEFTPL